jgi:hypothetical protein
MQVQMQEQGEMRAWMLQISRIQCHARYAIAHSHTPALLISEECTHRDGTVHDHIIVFLGEAEKKANARTGRAKSSGARVQMQPGASAKQRTTKQKQREDDEASYVDEPSRGRKKKKI